ncbi:G5 domain-containing protein, partial [Streptococcus mitis]|uniref:G5 domain-containing protein n=4 Tax=Streptococcus TaxID=1301 RepID=UPI002FD8BAE3
MSRQSTKNKKYALRKIGKVFGSCVVATVITLGGVAIMAPNVTVYASETESDPGENKIEDFASNDDGYEVIIPKGKKYIRNDESDNQTPKLIDPGYNGRSFILPKEGETGSLMDPPMSELFTKLYDKDGDGNIDDEYKNPEPVDNSHAGETIDDKTVPYRSEIDPKYPHVVDSGLTGDGLNKPGVWKYNPDGKYEASDGRIDEQDTIVVARKPIKVDENADENVVKEDGSVVLTSEYRIHVNKGDHIDKKDDVYEVGTKPTVTINEIDFKTIYEPNDQDVAGNQTIKTAGKKGTSTTTTTYTVNPETGVRTANPSTTEETEKPVNKVVLVGTKPKVEEKELPFTTRYVEDKTKDKDYRETTQQGVKGKETKTTTYTLDTTNGTVTENNPTTVTEQPKEEIITVGTKPKVEEKELPFTTRYVEDKT